MEIRALANRVLFGTSIRDKLIEVSGPLSDRNPGEAVVGEVHPGRPEGLEPRRAIRDRLPKPQSLRTTRDRSRVLQALANHELQALELFALALVRFVDAPRGLRRSWAESLRDEQRHLAAYLARLQGVGGELGEEPLSGFFWRALGGVDQPLRFVAGLQVGLEQANLDFARLWAHAFRRAGDAATAAVLDEVYQDEIRHLARGVSWLRQLKDPSHSDFEAFAQALVFPLTPTRARGPRLDRTGRRKAGLREAFIDRLAVTEVSRGRPPVVRWFDPHVEDAAAGRPRATSAIEADLAVLVGLLAGTGDVVVAPPPPTDFLLGWREAGLRVPQFVPALQREELPDGRVGSLAPWGWSPAARTVAANLGLEPPAVPAELHSKAWAARVLADFLAAHDAPARAVDVGQVCHSVDQALAAAAAHSGPVVTKAAFSASGQHRHWSLDGAPPPVAWLRRALASGPVVVERVGQLRAELSVHVDVDERGSRVRAVVRFGAHRGVFRGAVVGAPTLGLPTDVLRFMKEARGWAALEAAGRYVGERARALGYRGPLSVDAWVGAEGDTRFLKPISEVNGRHTMGRLAWHLRRQVAGVGPWCFLSCKAIRAAGHASPASFVGALRDRWPHRREPRGLLQGVVATNPPNTARLVQSLLWVGPTWAEAVEGLRSVLNEVGAPAGTAWITSGCPAGP